MTDSTLSMTTASRQRGKSAPVASADSGLELTGISKTLGGRTIIDGLDLAVRPGELVCLLGPSGCGKTTTLRMLGGFLRPDFGQILISGQDVTHLSPERRPTAMVFQNYALWPHMSVFKNVAYGLRLRKLPKETIRERVHEMLSLVNLSHHVHSHPGQISGGEQQRVALARALVLEPKVLLLDEPLSNLDAKLRLQVRDDIREIQQRLGITTVFVTHDQDEALSISDRIAVMNAGRVEQYAAPGALYREPATRFVAEFVGSMNFYSGRVTGDEVVLAPGDVRVPTARMSACPAGPVEVAVRPEDVRMEADTDDSVGVPATVVRKLPRGHYAEVVARIGEHSVRAFLGADFDAERVRVSFRRTLVYREGALVRDDDTDAPPAAPGADTATGTGVGP